MKRIIVRVTNGLNGFTIHQDTSHIKAAYPAEVWRKVPLFIQDQLSQTMSFVLTHHQTLSSDVEITYKFPPPLQLSFYYHGLFYSLPEMVIENENQPYKTSELLRKIFNSWYQINFTGVPKKQTLTTPLTKAHPHRVVIPFSFGKDSLLSYAVSREVGLDPKLFYIAEPESKYENKNKQALRNQFEKEFSTQINSLEFDIGRLRSAEGLMWGWDLLLLQYTLYLIPYLISLKAGYLFWSNEQSTSTKVTDTEGFIINSTFEQGDKWTIHMNNMLTALHIGSTIASIIRPIDELVITYILHHRYPEIGKYQLSCFNDNAKFRYFRWCGECYDCARVYIFLLATGVDPRRVGFKTDLLKIEKKELYYIFYEGKKGHLFLQEYDERYLAFYLAYKRGIKGELIELFKRRWLKKVERAIEKYIESFISVYPDESFSIQIKTKAMSIYKVEIDEFLKEIHVLRTAV